MTEKQSGAIGMLTKKIGLPAAMLTITALFFFSSPAKAQDAAQPSAPPVVHVAPEEPTSIEEKMVVEFLDTLGKFYTFDKPDTQAFIAFIEERIDPLARFTSEMHLNELVQPEIKTMNKESLLKDIRANYARTYDSKVKYKLEKFELQEEGKKAKIKYHVWMSAAYATEEPKTGRDAEVRLKSLALCDDIVTLSAGLIRILESKCVQDVSIAKPVFLE